MKKLLSYGLSGLLAVSLPSCKTESQKKTDEVRQQTQEILDKVILKASGEDKTLQGSELFQLARDLGYKKAYTSFTEIGYHTLAGDKADKVDFIIWPNGQSLSTTLSGEGSSGAGYDSFLVSQKELREYLAR